MLTAWAKKVAACARTNSGLPYVTVASSDIAMIEAKTIGGTTVYIPPTYQSTSWTPIVSSLIESGSSASTGVAFGTGSTAATENDYTLENQMTGIAATAPQAIVTAFDTENHRYVARLDYTVSNDTGAAITITEIGLFVRFNTASTRGNNASTTSANRYSILMDRTVLDIPVTIPDNEAAIIRYEFAYEG